MADLKLGYNTGYWSAGPPKGALEAVQEAEKLGFNSVWTAEAYGSDALTPLAWWGRPNQDAPAGHGNRSDGCAHSDCYGNGRNHDGPPL